MKVYELILKLSACNAGAEVVVDQHCTTSTAIEHFIFDGDVVTLSGGDAEIIDDDGDEIGKLSYHASVDDSDEETSDG